MRKTTRTSSLLVPVKTAIGTGIFTAVAFGACPLAIPFIPLFGWGLWRSTKKAIARYADHVAEPSADEIADAWERERRPGERGVSVSSTLYSRGSFFNLPITRTYHYEADKDDS
jgi:hypothetical protein